MFELFHKDQLLGTTKLFDADPSMGVLLSKEGYGFKQSQNFNMIRSQMVPSHGDSHEKFFTDLSLKTNCGEELKCLNIALSEMDLDGDLEYYVEVVGLDDDQFKKYIGS